MKQLTEISLADSAYERVQSIVGKRDGLTQFIFSCVPEWRYSAVAPVGTSSARLRQFDIGGLCKSSESKEWLMNFYSSELSSCPSALFVVEDVYARPLDICSNLPLGVTASVFRKSVTYSIAPAATHVEAIFDALRCCLSFATVGFLVCGTTELEESTEFARKVRSLLLTAYDQESFLIGRPVFRQ